MASGSVTALTAGTTGEVGVAWLSALDVQPRTANATKRASANFRQGIVLRRHVTVGTFGTVSHTVSMEENPRLIQSSEISASTPVPTTPPTPRSPPPRCIPYSNIGHRVLTRFVQK